MLAYHSAVRYKILRWGVSLALTLGPALGQPTATVPDGRDAYEHWNIYGEQVDLSQWRPELLERCYFQNRDNPANDAVGRIQDLMRDLNKDPALGRYLLNTAATHNTAFCMDGATDGNYSYFDLRQNVIHVKAFLGSSEQLIFLVHELRHLDTAARGFCPSLEYDLKEMSRLTLASEADAQAVSTLYAWRLRPQKPEVWDTLEGLELYGDIALAFEQEMSAGGGELDATRAAFEQWYASKQRTFTYHMQACLSYLDALDASHKVRSYTLLPQTYFDTFCVLPSGNYGCHLTDELTAAD